MAMPDDDSLTAIDQAMWVKLMAHLGHVVNSKADRVDTAVADSLYSQDQTRNAYHVLHFSCRVK